MHYNLIISDKKDREIAHIETNTPPIIPGEGMSFYLDPSWNESDDYMFYLKCRVIEPLSVEWFINLTDSLDRLTLQQIHMKVDVLDVSANMGDLGYINNIDIYLSEKKRFENFQGKSLDRFISKRPNA